MTDSATAPSSASSGLPATISFAIQADWTAEQARAVVELLDELREKIWGHYQLQLFDLIREQRQPLSVTGGDSDDPPF